MWGWTERKSGGVLVSEQQVRHAREACCAAVMLCVNMLNSQLQIGAQQYSIVMVFLNDEAMQQFRDSKGWEAGVDGSVAVAEWGAGDDINSKNFKDPIVAFVFGNKGLMAGVSIEGSKITKIKK